MLILINKKQAKIYQKQADLLLHSFPHYPPMRLYRLDNNDYALTIFSVHDIPQMMFAYLQVRGRVSNQQPHKKTPPKPERKIALRCGELWRLHSSLLGWPPFDFARIS